MDKVRLGDATCGVVEVEGPVRETEIVSETLRGIAEAPIVNQGIRANVDPDRIPHIHLVSPALNLRKGCRRKRLSPNREMTEPAKEAVFSGDATSAHSEKSGQGGQFDLLAQAL